MKDVFDEADEDTRQVFHESLRKEYMKTLFDIKSETGTAVEGDKRSNFLTLESMRSSSRQSQNESTKSFQSTEVLDYFQVDNHNQEKVISNAEVVDSLNDDDNKGRCPNYTAIFLLVSIAIAIGSSILVLNAPFSIKSNFAIRNNEMSLPIQEDMIPVILELPTKGSFSISTTLSKCLGLNSRMYNERLIKSYEVNVHL